MGLIQMNDIHFVNMGAFTETKGKHIIYSAKSHAVYIIDDFMKEIIETFQDKSDEEIQFDIKNNPESEKSKTISQLKRTDLFSARHYIPNQKGVNGIKLHVAHDCNLRCAYCYGWRHSKDGMYTGNTQTKMSEKMAIMAIDFLFQSASVGDTVYIAFHGGEPMLNWPVIKKVVLYAQSQCTKYNKGVVFSICTNGTIFNKDIALFFAKNGIKIVVSLDGDEKSNSARTFEDGTPSYQKVIDNIKRYQLLGCQVSSQVTVHHQNLSIVNSSKYLKSLGITSVLLNLNRLFAQDDEYALSEYDIWSLVRQFDELIQWEMSNFRMSKSFFVTNLSRMYNSLLFSNPIWNYCSLGLNNISIAPDGNAYICEWFMGESEGQLGNISEKKIGFNQDFVRNLMVDARPLCQNCWARFLCGGPCVYESYQRYGNLTTASDHLCELQRSIADSIIVAFAYQNGELLTNISQ